MIGLPISAWLPAPMPHLARSGELLLELAQEAKVRVEVPKRFSDERIFLDRRGVPPMVALRAVAAAMNATLVPTKNGYELARPEAQLAAIRGHRGSVRAGWLEARLKETEKFRKARAGDDALVKAARKDVEAIRDLAAGRSFQFPASSAVQLMPCAELLEGLISRIGVSALAQIPSGEIRVFETDPVSTSAPLPRSADLLMAYRDSAGRLVERGVPDLLDKEMREARGYLDYTVPAKVSEVVHLRLECTSTENGMWFLLEGYDRGGKRLDQSRLFAGVDGSLAAPTSFVAEAKVRSEASWRELSASSRAGIASGGNFFGAKVPEWFYEPEKRDPLDLFVAEAVSDLAADDQGPCVAYAVFDSWWGSVRNCTAADGRLSLSSLRKVLNSWLPYECVRDAESVVWRPLDPEIAEARQADRKVLGRFAKAYAKNGQVSAGDKARLYHDAGPEIGTLPDVWSDIVRAQILRNQSGADYIGRVYAFLGGISATDWSLLLRGRTLTAGKMGVVSGLRKVLEGESGLSLFSENPLTDLQGHPLELYGGDLASTPISLIVKSKPLVKYWKSAEEEASSFWMPADVLTATFDISGTFHFENGEWICRFGRERYEKLLNPFTIQTAPSSCLSLTIGLPKGVRLMGDGAADAGRPSNPFAYSSLPEGVRAEQWNRAYQVGLRKAQGRGR